MSYAQPVVHLAHLLRQASPGDWPSVFKWLDTVLVEKLAPFRMTAWQNVQWFAKTAKRD